MDESENSIQITQINQTIKVRYTVSFISNFFGWQITFATSHAEFLNATIPSDNIFQEATADNRIFSFNTGNSVICTPLGAKYAVNRSGILCDLYFTLTGNIGEKAVFLIETNSTMLVNSTAQPIPYTCHEDDRVD